MKKLTKNDIVPIVVVSCIIVIIAVVAITINYYFYAKHYEFTMEITSPNGEYTLVVKEWSQFRTGGAEIYKKGFIFDTKIGSVTYDDYNVGSFENGWYSISWNKDSIAVSYYYGNGSVNNEENWNTKLFKLT